MTFRVVASTKAPNAIALTTFRLIDCPFDRI